MSQALHDAQRAMAQYLRDPEGRYPPPSIEPRRLQVYRDLVYNNIEGFISSGFPVLRSLYDADGWEQLVRSFIQQHRCSTPLFLRISEEFLAFLVNQEEHVLRPFEAELAHYEWLELAVDVAPGAVPPLRTEAAPNTVKAVVSPVARLGSYRFPVHRIGQAFQPTEADQPAFLVVYRDRQSRVQFMELNAGSARLIHEVEAGSDSSVAALLDRLATEWNMDPATLKDFGWQQLIDFNECGIIGLTALGDAD